MYDYGGPEPMHAVANLRLSQNNLEEAVQSVEEAFGRLRLCGMFTMCVWGAFLMKTGGAVDFCIVEASRHLR